MALLEPRRTEPRQPLQSGGVCRPAEPDWPPHLTGQADAPVRVLLVDGDEFARRVIAQELLSDLRIRLEGQAASATVARQLIASLDFDVLMIDLHLPIGAGLGLIREARRRHRHCEIIVVSTVEDDAHVLHALKMGASGYLLKRGGMQSFSQAALQVVNGGAAITPSLTRRLLLPRMVRPADHDASNDPTPVALPGAASGDALLTAREREVLRCVARGHVSREISAQLGIAPQTVDAHVKNICKKLRVRSRAQAVSCATRTGQL
jgi:DNA-binding NarL/FixJ family response regulator